MSLIKGTTSPILNITARLLTRIDSLASLLQYGADEDEIQKGKQKCHEAGRVVGGLLKLSIITTDDENSIHNEPEYLMDWVPFFLKSVKGKAEDCHEVSVSDGYLEIKTNFINDYTNLLSELLMLRGVSYSWTRL